MHFMSIAKARVKNIYKLLIHVFTMFIECSSNLFYPTFCDPYLTNLPLCLLKQIFFPPVAHINEG